MRIGESHVGHMTLCLFHYLTTRLGAWQFMADMPYGSVSLLTTWKILWTLYHYQLKGHSIQNPPVGVANPQTDDFRERRGSVITERLYLDTMPETAEEIVASIRGNSCDYVVHICLCKICYPNVFIST